MLPVEGGLRLVLVQLGWMRVSSLALSYRWSDDDGLGEILGSRVVLLDCGGL